MQQKLILPVNRTRVTASAFNRAYRERFGYPHYGTDLVSAVGTARYTPAAPAH